MRRTILTTLTAMSLGLISTALVNAGTVLYDFTTDPSSSGFTLSGNAIWVSTGGNSGGFVQLTDALDGLRGAILLPDFDSGRPIKAFTVSMDVKVGSGTDLPGEGWSINFVPATAQVVANGADGPGWASDFTPTANLPERGSTEGLGVYALTYDHGGGDVLGFNARYNQVEFALGGWTVPPTGPKVYNGACTDPNTLQTGPIGNLCWANFTMTMHENGTLDIYWKGTPIVTNFTTPWTPQAGRWILGARTSSGINEVHNFDNISITTTLADKPVLANFFGYAGGFSYQIQDIPGAALNPASVQLTLDGASVTATSVTKVLTNTTILYSSLLAPGSHKATIAYSSQSGSSASATNTFTVTPYPTLPSSYAVTGVNTSQSGFKVRPYQTAAAQPNDLTWTEGQLAGLYGPNIADLSGADAQGFYLNTGVINYDIEPGSPHGHFDAPNYQDTTPPGIPGTTSMTGNFAEEIITWLYFPTTGAYVMGVNSDDGFKVTTSGVDVRDPNGMLLGSYNGGRGAADNLFTFAIQTPGYYPFRLVWENGNGELPGNLSSCEWFTQLPDGSFALINDTSNPGAIRAYSSGPVGLPFVQLFTGNLQGFTYLVTDGSTAVAGNTIQTTLNGLSVTPVISKSGSVTTISYNPPQPLPSPSTNVVVLTFADSGTTPVTQNITNAFTVAGAIVPHGVALTTGVDTTAPGFLFRPYQTTAVQPNRVWWTEQQLAGLMGPNIADLSTANNGWFTNDTVVNYDAISADGHFTFNNGYTDLPFPGLPAGGSDPCPNASAEILTWVNFPAAGTYTMGVNSDDGFKVTIGKNPRDQFSTLLGQFNDGRGSSDTIFQFYIPDPGFYPMRLIWENGGGGANLEWFTVQSDGSFSLINDSADPRALKAYRSGPLDPHAYVSVVRPVPGEQGVDPTTPILVQFTDGSYQVDATSISLYVNGAVLAPSINKSAGTTTVRSLMPYLPSGSTNSATLVYKEIGASASVTQTWAFVLSTYPTVPANLATPVGSGVASKPGFRYRVDQIPLGYNNSELNSYLEAAEQFLAGLWGPNQGLSSSNIADVTTFTDNGYLDIPGIVNFSGNGGELGNFTSANGLAYADTVLPGVVANGPSANPSYTDQFATEFLTYIEFPTPGIYTMGVSSDDCFAVMPTDKQPKFIGATLHFSSPQALVGRRIPGDPTWAASGGFGSQLSTTPMTAKIVLANPDTACSTLANAADLAGNIALTYRGTCEFGAKALAAQQAGAIACLIVNNRQDLPISLGAGAVGSQVTIPVLMLHQNDGDLIKSHLADPGGVWVTLGEDPELIVGQYNNQGGRGTADTWFSFGIPQAGVYPFRLIWNQGGGGYSCEWFSVDPYGNRTLINDTAPGALKAYRARVASNPTLSLTRSGSSLMINYQGTLQWATSATGPFSDVPNAASPYALTPGTGARFFRAYW